MSTNTSQPESVPSEQSSTPPGPTLLAERSLLGIFVHVFGIVPFWGVVVPALVYRLSDHEFTRANARNVCNWQLLVTGSLLASVLGVLVWETVIDWLPVPGVVETVLALPVFAVVIVAFGLTWLNFVFPFVAMGTAVFGSAWRYPIAPDLAGLLAAHARSERRSDAAE